MEFKAQSSDWAFFCALIFWGIDGWYSTLCRADTAGCEKGRKGHKGQEGLSVFGVEGAMCCGISADYGSLAGMAGTAHCAEPILRAGEYGPSFAPAELWRASGAHGIEGAMCCGISADYGSLEAYFFCTMCLCVIPGLLPTLYPVPLSFSSFLSFLSFTLPAPCAPHKVLCQPTRHHVLCTLSSASESTRYFPLYFTAKNP